MSGGMPGTDLFGWIGAAPDLIGRGLSDGFAAAAFDIDREEETEVKVEMPPETYLVCTTLSGGIEWDMRVTDRRVDRPCARDSVDMAYPGESAEIRYSKARATFVHFYLPARWLAAPIDAMVPSARPSAVELIDPRNAPCGELGRHGRRVLAAMRRGAPCQLELESIGLGVASTLLRLHSNVAPPTEVRGGLSGAQLRRVTECLAAHLADEVTLNELAAIAGLSPHHFCRAFKQATGLPPHRFRLMMRLERAKEMLADPIFTIADVAACIGYDDQSQLTRLFQREVGVSPTGYRRDLRS